MLTTPAPGPAVLLRRLGRRKHIAGFEGSYLRFLLCRRSTGESGGRPEANQVGWGRVRGTMDVDFGKLIDWNGLEFPRYGAVAIRRQPWRRNRGPRES